MIVILAISKVGEVVHIHVECIEKCWLLVFVSTIILLIMFSTGHFDTASHWVAVAPYRPIILLVNESDQNREEYLDGKTRI